MQTLYSVRTAWSRLVNTPSAKTCILVLRESRWLDVFDEA